MSTMSRDNGYHGSLNIICDFDGTIAEADTTDLILSRLALPQWEEIERQWLDGLISSRECMYQQVGLLRADKESLDGLIDEIQLTPGFVEFAAYADEHMARPRIVSDGLDYVIERVLATHGIQGLEVAANHLLFTSRGFELEFPYSRTDCGSGVCKCAAAEGAGGNTILIGDGRSDLCLAGRADLVLARRGRALERYCLEYGRPYAVYDDFYDLISFFEMNLNQPPLAGWRGSLSQFRNPVEAQTPGGRWFGD